MKHLRRGISASIRNNSSAYAYSVLITASFGLTQLEAGAPAAGEIFAFVLGAGLAFTVVEAVVSRFFRNRIRPERSEVVVLGSAFALVSVTGALGSAWLVSALLPTTWLCWGGTAFAATLVYLLLAGLEMALALHTEEKHPPKESE